MTEVLIADNGGKVYNGDTKKSAAIVAVGAIEARVAGVPRAAMSITGSGSHGILAMMPLYAACKAEGRSEEELLRAVCLSCLVTIYIKEYSGRLSALCGLYHGRGHRHCSRPCLPARRQRKTVCPGCQ